MKRLFLLVFPLLMFASCLTDTVPYLSLTMEELFTEGETISFQYEFSSESEFQPCRIQVWDLNDEKSPYWDNSDEEMYYTGVIGLLLGEGDYRLDFTVLSDRYDSLTELSFLSESVVFRVESIN